ncbi:WD40-like Beta Propeller Repeat [Chitinophaga sp. YR627]|uniref:OmpA family protein n=1 Tax=Chitinophaga sp. YR627 TaxID=1881041 RepID=UPI0008E5821E|nr:OmpA family protein [Chitinophaga sp. YR627]SFN73236.1 WD40-like Beta Propeller Repeat [Chitinophaga sp. YR627]
MKKNVRYWLVIALLWTVSTARAQYVYDYKRTGDIYFEAKDYYSAAQYYNRALGTFKIKPEQILPYTVELRGKESGKLKDYETVIYKLAESYRHYYDYGNAEKYYEQAVGFNNTTLFPLARFWYGVCLRANGKYTNALEQFTKFKQEYNKTDDISARATLEIASCEFAVSEASRMPGYTISKLSGDVNAGGANYAPAVLAKNTLLYTSSRPDSSDLEKEKKSKKVNPYINNLFVATGEGSNFSNSRAVTIPEATGIDQGVATVSPDGNTIYLTRWTTKNGIKAAAIYSSKRKGNEWEEPKVLGANVNVDGYSSMQPFVTSDGKYLLFASNRPGGMGKNDLWYCALENGTAGAAKNFGTNINTRDEEQAPFYDGERKALIFSTDGRVGLGGLDFFVSDGDFSSWGSPKNLGLPLNSPKDDVYFTAADRDHPMAGGYISSDRESVCCLEVFTIKKISKTINGLVLDCDGDLPLTGAKVTLLDTIVQRVIGQVTLDETGRYRFEVEPLKHYKIMAEKENYFSKAIYVNTDDLTKVDSLVNQTICLKRYEIGKPIILKDIYYDFDKATLRPQSLIVLDTVVSIMQDNPNIIIEMSAHTDSKGKDEYNMKLSQRRAQSCVDYLISKGISSDRMIAKGYGETRPIAPNTLPNGKDNPEGRQLNRRTEFKVLRVTQLNQ